MSLPTTILFVGLIAIALILLVIPKQIPSMYAGLFESKQTTQVLTSMELGPSTCALWDLSDQCSGLQRGGEFSP